MEIIFDRVDTELLAKIEKHLKERRHAEIVSGDGPKEHKSLFKITKLDMHLGDTAYGASHVGFTVSIFVNRVLQNKLAERRKAISELNQLVDDYEEKSAKLQ